MSALSQVLKIEKCEGLSFYDVLNVYIDNDYTMPETAKALGFKASTFRRITTEMGLLPRFNAKAIGQRGKKRRRYLN